MTSSRDLCTLFGSDRYQAKVALRTAARALLSVLLALAAVLAVMLLILFALPVAVALVCLAGRPARRRQESQSEAESPCECSEVSDTQPGTPTVQESAHHARSEPGRPGDQNTALAAPLPQCVPQRIAHTRHATSSALAVSQFAPTQLASSHDTLPPAAEQEAASIDRRAIEWAEEESALEAAAQWALDRAALRDAGFVLHAPPAPLADRSPSPSAPEVLAPPPMRSTGKPQATSDKPIDKTSTEPTAQATYDECAVLTVAQLRKAAAAYGVRGTRTMRKGDLLAALFPTSRPLA